MKNYVMKNGMMKLRRGNILQLKCNLHLLVRALVIIRLKMLKEGMGSEKYEEWEGRKGSCWGSGQRDEWLKGAEK